MTNHDAALRAAQPGDTAATASAGRHVQLALLVCAAGAIYPMLYLRQFYQDTMLDLFQITRTQLGYLYSALGTTFLVCYLPSAPVPASEKLISQRGGRRSASGMRACRRMRR
jgi:hypothetical protein